MKKLIAYYITWTESIHFYIQLKLQFNHSHKAKNKNGIVKNCVNRFLDKNKRLKKMVNGTF